MRHFICLQAGHENAKNNCDPALRGGTGAPGEVEFTVRIRNRLKDILLSKKNPDGSDAFMVQLVDACYNCDPKADDQDYALFLAVHWDADVYKNPRDGGFLDFPEPSTDGATQESQRIKREMEAEYFKHSGIENRPNRSNANTRYFYMWKFLSMKTPCVIIECGVGQDPHDKVILADPDRVPNAIARGICRAFGVPFDAPPAPQPQPTPQPTPPAPQPTPVPPAPVPGPVPEPAPSPEPIPPAIDYKKLLYEIVKVIFGKGYVWQKLSRIKAILTEAGL